MTDKKRFPRDCSRKCPHYHTWDLSIDDWTSVCDLLKAQIDDCDMDFQWMYCPLDNHYKKMDDQDKLIVAHLAKRFAETPLIKRASWSEVEDE